MYSPHWAAQPSAALALSQECTKLDDPVPLQDHLVALSQSSALRSKLGTTYSEIVETCLACLDEDNLSFGDENEFTQMEPTNVGTQYIEKVLEPMNNFSI